MTAPKTSVATPSSPKLRVIPEAENFSAKTTYKGKGIIEATFALRRGEGQPRYEKDCTFDFSRVSEEQLYLLAMYGAKVKVQAVLRAMLPEAMLNPRPFNVSTCWPTFWRRAANPKTRSKLRSGR